MLKKIDKKKGARNTIMTKIYDSNCLTKVYEDIKDFHVKFGHPAPSTVTKLTDDRKQARSEWICEELNEFLQSGTIHDDMDAMIDMLYFVMGTIVEMGIDPSNIFAMVHNANMAKLFPDGKPHYNDSGKVIKPEGWKAPDDDIKEYINELIKNEADQLTILNE